MSDLDISDWSYEDIIEQQQAEINKLQKVVSGETTNKMKADCIGEFYEDIETDCPDCDGGSYQDLETDQCGTCDNTGFLNRKVMIQWTTCKEIYRAMLKSSMTDLQSKKRESTLEINARALALTELSNDS